MTNCLERLLLVGVVTGSLIFGLGRAIAQQYEPRDNSNPNYCTECREESNRDFAKCGEIDYSKIVLYSSNRLGPTEHPFGYPDQDKYLERVVLSANIDKDMQGEHSEFSKFMSERKGKFEIFVMDKNGQRRLTWDAGSQKANILPFWTKERNIACSQAAYNGNTRENKFILMDMTGKKIKDISAEEYIGLYKESHQGAQPDVLSIAPSQ